MTMRLRTCLLLLQAALLSGSCPDIEVGQPAMLYSQSLEPENLTTINCQHSCDPSIDISQFHPTLTIQIPNDYTPYPLHSETLEDAVLSSYNLTGQVTLRYFKNDTCENDSFRHFGLEISDINTTRLNNSVLHCGVMSFEPHCIYRGDGVIFLQMPPQPPEIPTPTLTSSNAPDPTTSTVPSSSDVPTSPTPPPTTPSQSPSVQPQLDVTGITTGGSLGGLLVGAVLGIIFTTLVCSVRHPRKIAPLREVAGRAQRSLPDKEAEKQAHTAPLEQPVHDERDVSGVRMTEEQPVGASGEQHIGASGEQHVGASGEQHVGASGEQHVGASGEQHVGASGEQHVGASGEQHVGGESEPPNTGGERGQWLDTIAYSVRNPAFLMEDPNTPPDTPSTTNSPPTTPSSLPTTPSRTHSPGPTIPSRTCLSQS